MATVPAVSAAFGPLLFECARLLDDLAQAEVNRDAGRPVLTPALVRLLPHLSSEGVRPSALARRVEVSKQAVGQALGDLESRGFVEMVSDPADGRARLVRLTPAGLAAFDDGRRVLAFFEAALAARVGRGRMETLTATLQTVHAVLADWTTGVAPRRDQAAPGGAVTRRGMAPAEKPATRRVTARRPRQRP